MYERVLFLSQEVIIREHIWLQRAQESKKFEGVHVCILFIK